MAEEATPGGRPAPWARLWELAPPAVQDWPHTQVVALSAMIALLTFAVYWFGGPRETIFINHVSQANNLLHGHLDLRPEYSGFITEPALYDGEGFCEAGRPGCRMYLQHPPGPALLLMPAVAVWGLDTNQTFVSVILASATAVLAFLVFRRLAAPALTQLVLTAMLVFGSIFWFSGANGGVWYFSHTAAVMFLFAALYFTFVHKNPFLTGLALGAAFLCRNPVILSFPFFLIMHAEQWLPAGWRERPLLQKVRYRPLFELGYGLSLFAGFALAWNYARFDDPFQSGYGLSEQVFQDHLQGVYNRGILHPSYIQRHLPVVLEQTPVFGDRGSYVWPSWAGQAIWLTTPAFLLALFAGLKDRRIIAAGATALGMSAFLIITRAMAGGWGGPDWWARADFNWGWRVLPGLHLWPIYIMIGAAIAAAVLALLRRDDPGLPVRREVLLACWAAIVPVALANFLFAATGWAQFGYRYGMDFYPFLFVLTAMAVHRGIRWHHGALIAAGVLINLWGVLWIMHFDGKGLWGWTWVSF